MNYTNNLEIKKWYLESFNTFEDQLNGEKNTPFHQIRKNAISKFSDIGFPSLRVEEWRYTDISSLLKHRFPLTKTGAYHKLDLNKYGFAGLETSLLVFVNGQFSEDLSKIQINFPGLIIDNLANVLNKNLPEVENYLSKYAQFNDETFTALNTAFATEGVFIFVPTNVEIDIPIHILNISDSKEPFVSHPRHLIIAENNSNVKIVESFYGNSDLVYFNNPVSEVVLKENSFVNYTKIQNESEQAYLISNMFVHQERSSNFTANSIDLGGALVRNNLNVKLNDENCETNLYGFYMVNGTQLIDNHTNMDHAKPHCQSNELYKGILADKSKGVFSGAVHVRQNAQKTNAFQKNKNLLLSEDAEINSKPQLKIFADDVRCTHGATIGQLNDEAIFYLQQRGVKKENALSMLRYAFAADVFNNISIDSVRLKVDQLVMEKFNRLQDE